MPRTGPGLPARPPGAVSGGTQLLPPEAGGPSETLAPAEAPLRRRGVSTSHEPPPSRRGLVVGLVLVGVAGIAAGAFLLLRPDGASTRAPRPPGEVDDRAASRRAVVTPEERPPPAEERPAVPPPARKPAREERPSVVVRINSTPSGATVLEARTGKTLGETPFEGAFPRDRGEARLVVRKSGYRSKDVTVKLGADADLSVTLDKRRAAEPEDSGDDRRKL
jgi:hypothetical protein